MARLTGLLLLLVSLPAQAQWAVIDVADLIHDILNEASTTAEVAQWAEQLGKLREVYDKYKEIEQQADQIEGALRGPREDLVDYFNDDAARSARRAVPDRSNWYALDPYWGVPSGDPDVEAFENLGRRHLLDYVITPEDVSRAHQGGTTRLHRITMQMRERVVTSAGTAAAAELELGATGTRMSAIEATIARLRATRDLKGSSDVLVRSLGHESELATEGLRLRALELRLEAQEMLEQSAARERTSAVFGLSEE